MRDYTINIRGRLFDLSQPRVMGILNVTPDSFYALSRQQTEADIRHRTEEIIREGGDIIDIGAYSTRPGAQEVSAEEERERLTFALKIVRDMAPDIPVSIDTFRADIAQMAVEELGADIVNDISGGQLDPAMFSTVSRLGVPYILMHTQGTPQTMQQHTEYADLMQDMLLYFAQRVQQLRDLGQKDIILDPGYGFAKTLEQNYLLLQHQEEFSILQLPLLVGFSRKSMIYRLLDTTPEGALNGTTVLNTIALTKGASILRVHDVKAAAEAVLLYNNTYCHV